MLVAPFKVVLDANLLYPFTLRDTLLRAASEGLFQLYWSAEIRQEAVRNLVASRTMTAKQGAKLREAMEQAFPEADVTGYESLIAAMQNDPKDRHVVAVAVKAGAQVIVTMNLRDFRELPEGIEAQSPAGRHRRYLARSGRGAEGSTTVVRGDRCRARQDGSWLRGGRVRARDEGAVRRLPVRRALTRRDAPPACDEVTGGTRLRGRLSRGRVLIGSQAISATTQGINFSIDDAVLEVTP